MMKNTKNLFQSQKTFRITHKLFQRGSRTKIASPIRRT
uniref:Uncharacterized protein n=1 Tax=Tetranychus urticae TaxID=32264 RepID=T1KNE9_TETUR